MNRTIRIGICGYGNLGRGVESELLKNPDLEAVAVFSRREITTNTGIPVVAFQDAASWKDKIDVMILCGASATDLPTQGPEFAKHCNIVDSYDTHAKIPEYMQKVDQSAKSGGKLAVISIGWDPGLFSLMRLMMGAVIPAGKTYSFWGDGVSQGHSEVVRRVEGVADAVQYTLPVPAAMERVRKGESPALSTREKHTRVCYVVAEEGADKARIEAQIKAIPHYFDEYDTTVHFITAEEREAKHSKLPHGGYTIHMGETGEENKQIMEFSLKLDSNPEFTASVLVAYARAAYQLAAKGECGARTIFDIPPVLLSAQDPADLIRDLL